MRMKESTCMYVRTYMRTVSAFWGAFFFFAAAFFMFAPAFVSAAEEDLKVAGWIPYWAKTEGTKSAIANLDKLDAVYPFVFTVRQDGTLNDLGTLKGKEWQKLFRAARAKDVDVIPTITSGDGAAIHALLSDPKKRKKHVDEIMEMVEKGKYDGVDIDYESRTKATIVYFSLFLTELKIELDEKKLVCTLEPRTPPDSLWKEVPNPLPYSNDYPSLKQVCDVVQIMTYDQQRADLKLNESKSGQPYFPNSDPDWAEKVVDLTTDSIAADKIMLGVPTYGRHLQVSVAPDWFNNYAGLGAFNQPAALALAKKFKVKPSENRAGEQSVTYLPKETPKKVAAAIKKMKVPKDTTTGMKVAMQALAYANKTGETVNFNLVWWSDANAIADKVEIAKKYGLRGIAIFKIDGEEDKKLWNLF